MNIKHLISTTLLISFFTNVELSAQERPSDLLAAALDGLDKSKVQCYCVCEFDGKSQMAAGVEMAKILEEELAENEGLPDVRLSDYINCFIGISSGSVLASNFALGGNANDIKEILSSLKSKMIVPESFSGCLVFFKKSVQLASYFVNDSSDISNFSNIFGEEEKTENNYDKFKLDPNNISAISRLTSGTEHDLKAGLIILSTSDSSNFSEQVFAAMKEADNAAKKNISKSAFDAILNAAKSITSLTIETAGSRINRSSAEKALEIMTKVEKTAENLNTGLDNTFFKQNLTRNLAEPSSDCPILVIDLKAKTGIGKAINTKMTQEFRDNFVKVTYLMEFPISMYPGKNQPFELIEPSITSAIRNLMQSIRLDSAKATDILTDFLTDVKTTRNTVQI